MNFYPTLGGLRVTYSDSLKDNVQQNNESFHTVLQLSIESELTDFLVSLLLGKGFYVYEMSLYLHILSLRSRRIYLLFNKDSSKRN